MCKAFSGIATRNKVYWRFGMDSHNDIVIHFKLKDDKIGKLIPFEISPKNGDYLNPDEWIFKFDDECPDWWKKSHEKMCWEAFNKWKKKLDSILIKKEIIHPFKIKHPKISKYHISLLKEWASVRASVRDSVWDSVWASVRVSVGVSVWDSVWASVRDSVRAYTGSFFNIPRKQWKYPKNIKCRGCPFKSAVKLWKMGLVPSFDGNAWRLHGGKNAKTLFKISEKELMK